MQNKILQEIITAVTVSGFAFLLLTDPIRTLFGGRSGEWYALLGDPEIVIYQYFFFILIGPMLLLYGLFRFSRLAKHYNTLGVTMSSKVFDLYIGIISILCFLLTVKFYLSL